MEFTLRCGAISAVTTDHGAELISLQDAGGKEYIWNGDPAYWGGRNPNLFPIVGNLKDDTIFVDGKPYHMKRHGFARNSVYSVAEQGENYIVFELTDNTETMAVYPFHFSLKIRHELHENGFFTSYEVTNRGNSVMPYTVGGHTAFRCPMNPGEQFSDYKIVFDHEEDAYAKFPNSKGLLVEENKIYALNHTATLPLLHENFAELDTYIFEGLQSTGAALISPDGHGIRIDFPGMPMIAFWTAGAKKAPYVCMEPWHGCAHTEGENGEFTDKHNCILLNPGERKTLGYKVSII